MRWTQQRQLVESLSDQAQDKRRDAQHVRGNLKMWMKDYVGSVETLVWLFAAGAFWTAGHSSAAQGGTKRRSLIAAINTSLFAWQLVNRQFSFAPPTAGNPSEEQR